MGDVQVSDAGRKRTDEIIESLTQQHDRGTYRGAGRLLKLCAEPQSLREVYEIVTWYLEGENGKFSARIDANDVAYASKQIAKILVTLADADHLFINNDPNPDFHEPDIDAIGRAPFLVWQDGMQVEEGNLYKYMPNEIYHALDGASNSRLRRLALSPAHARYEPPVKTSTDKLLGSAIHAAVLEPAYFEKSYLLLPNVKDRRASAYKDAAKHHDPDLILVSSDIDRVAAAQATVFADPNAGRLLRSPGWAELSGVSRCPYTGARVRFRYDKLTEDLIGIDVKTTHDASDEGFSKTATNFGYFQQAALYSDQFHALTGLRLKSWVFLVIESKPPHGVRLFVVDDEDMMRGRRQYLHYLRQWKKCEETNTWPLPDSKPTTLSMTRWGRRMDDELFGPITEYENEVTDG